MKPLCAFIRQLSFYSEWVYSIIMCHYFGRWMLKSTLSHSVCTTY